MAHPDTIATHSTADRDHFAMAHKEMLAEWEKNRRQEVWIDLYAHFWRCAVGLSIGALLWWAIGYFGLSYGWRVAFAYCAASYLAGTIIVWLRVGKLLPRTPHREH